ncbi:MAG: copper resistance protein CopC [Noviherbaspirillum sp.]
MKSTRRHGLTLLFAAASMAGYAPAWAHAALQAATPAKDAEVSPAPAEIVLRFNEKLEPAFSSAKLLDSAGRQLTIEKARLDASNPAVMKLPLPALTAGRYKVEYVVVGHDGHRRPGSYFFTVK